MSKPFKFKQFTIEQDRCAMKVGTDGVLLGAWTSLNTHPFSILDMGAGTGVISLMLAQRSNAQQIDAIEIDENAYEQCTENFENSSWNDRLFCYHASVQEFAQEIEDQYDVIVSNPPFYTEDYKSQNTQRDLARFADALPFEHLAICASHLLNKEGLFSIILPFREEERFTRIAEKSGLFPLRICHVKGTPTSDIKRSLLEFSFNKVPVETSELVIERSRHQYTKQYINLTKDFYLKM